MSDLGSLQRNRRPHAAPDRTRASVNTSGTRFHRTGRWNCEASSATNEEHWTLLPDHLQRGWTPPRRPSDRLTPRDRPSTARSPAVIRTAVPGLHEAVTDASRNVGIW